MGGPLLARALILFVVIMVVVSMLLAEIPGPVR
jgi:hypothetical protein